MLTHTWFMCLLFARLVRHCHIIMLVIVAAVLLELYSLLPSLECM